MARERQGRQAGEKATVQRVRIRPRVMGVGPHRLLQYTAKCKERGRGRRKAQKKGSAGGRLAE